MGAAVMSVFLTPKTKDVYQFDFRINRQRFHGSTRCTDIEEAKRFEAVERSRAKRKVAETLQRKVSRLQPPKRRRDPDIPDIGVYLLMLNGEVVYIGSSLDMPERVA